MKSPVIVAALLLGACGKTASEQPIGKKIEIEAPLGLPALPVPIFELLIFDAFSIDDRKSIENRPIPNRHS